MKLWRAPYSFQTALYLVAAMLLLVLAGAGVVQLLPFARVPIEEWPISLRLFALVCSILLAIAAAVLLVVHARRRASLRYQLDRNAVTVQQQGWRYTIPLDQIIAVQVNKQPESEASAKPVLRFGRGGAAQTLVLETPGNRYHLAIRRKDQFAHELQERRQLGVVQRQFEGLQRTENRWIAFTSSATARWLTLLILGLNLSLWGLLTWQYPNLPETIPIRFDPVGGTAGTRTRSYTLLFPTVGMIVGWINFGLAVFGSRRTRLAGELLLIGALLVQLVLLAVIWFVVMGPQ